MPDARALNIRYSTIQALFFIGACALMGFTNIYLKSAGLTTSAIGLVISSGNVLATILQPTLAGYSDAHHVPACRILGALSVFCAIGSLLSLLFSSVPLFISVLFALMLAPAGAMQPFLNVLAFSFEQAGITLNYGVARAIGSVVYALTSLALGYLVTMFSPQLIPVVALCTMLAAALLVRGFQLDDGNEEALEGAGADASSKESAGSFIRSYGVFFLFLVGVALVYMDHQIVNIYMIDIMQSISGNESAMGTAIFIAAIVEFPAMVIYQHFHERLNTIHVLIFSGIMFSVKHLLSTLATNIMLLYLAQTLQAFGFALFIPASVYFVDELFSRKDAAKGQSLITTSMTVAGIVATSLGGFMFDLAGVHATLAVFCAISVAGTLVMAGALLKIERAGRAAAA